MTERRSGVREWATAQPVAEDLLAASDLDSPPEGFEARLLERLEGAPAVVSAAESPSDLEPPHAKRPVAIRRYVAAAVAAMVAAAAFKISTHRHVAHNRQPPVAQQTTSAEAPAVVLCESAVRADPSFALIDDFEDGNGRMLAYGGRFGTWNYITVDRPAEPVVAPLRPDQVKGSTGERALHALASGMHDWRAVWASFGPPCYDASPFTGVRFRAKGPTRIGFELSMVDYVERSQGGTCDGDCYHPHRKIVTLGGAFARFEVRFAELEQPPDTPDDARRSFDPRRLKSLAFVADPEQASVDFWIDDVEWMR